MKPKILFVDDDENNLKAFKKDLKLNEDYEILISNNTNDAYQLIKDENISVVICDTVMPNTGGLELKARLNKDNISTPFIGMSGISEYRKQWKDLGCYFLEKPIFNSDLYNNIEEALK
ncbi:response regulator [candidate division KSB1 bacterium]|nr:response regulator [candidate division KSB1 bacterium]